MIITLGQNARGICYSDMCSQLKSCLLLSPCLSPSVAEETPVLAGEGQKESPTPCSQGKRGATRRTDADALVRFAA